jgi:addiction module HigA family antidote
MTMARKLAPIHPGEVLLEEFLIPLGLSQYRLAKSTGVPPRRINEIVLEKRSISADTALRLGRYLGTTAQFWLNLQARYDLKRTRDGIAEELETEIKPFKSAA